MISIIIPFHNEEDNLEKLHTELESALGSRNYEIIFIDDGSIDNSKFTVQRLKEHDSRITVLTHQTKMGKGKALADGFEASRGELIVFMDADLQDDPADLPKFFEKINEGYDAVNGWRKHRKDRVIMNFLSKIGNTLIWRTLLNSQLHDVNCGFKALKREILMEIPLYGDNFRFVPLVAKQHGYKVGEVVVHHRSRIHGTSKYSFTKAFFGFFDTVTTYFIFRFSEKPLHFFGVVGGVLFGLGAFVTTILVIQRLFYGELLYRRPALQFALLFIIVGLQIIMTGIVAELLVYLNKKKPNS